MAQQQGRPGHPKQGKGHKKPAGADQKPGSRIPTPQSPFKGGKGAAASGTVDTRKTAGKNSHQLKNAKGSRSRQKILKKITLPSVEIVGEDDEPFLKAGDRGRWVKELKKLLSDAETGRQLKALLDWHGVAIMAGMGFLMSLVAIPAAASMTIGALLMVAGLGPVAYDVWEDFKDFDFAVRNARTKADLHVAGLNRQGGMEKWTVRGGTNNFRIDSIDIKIVRENGTFRYPLEM